MERRDQAEERRRDAIAATARDHREQAAKNGHTISQDAAERRVRQATAREDRRNPRS